MRELSIEEKAKAYDNALEVLHKYDGANIMFSQALKEEMFPELAESEDERIKKALIFHYQGDGCICTNGYIINYKDIRAWLEKQGEQKSYASETMNEKGDFDNGFTRMMEKEQKSAWSEEDEKIFNFIGDILSEAYEVTNRTNVLPFLQVRDWLLLHLRPQSTWKPSDEQMKALKLSTNCPSEQMSKVLLELYQDLKKLKEK